jgi:hypothetical protein
VFRALNAVLVYNCHMFSWAQKRKLIYGSATFLFLLCVIGIPVYLTYFNNPPTCTDHVQNGNEQGVDCGGFCVTACAGEVLPEPIVLWSRPFSVARGLNNLIAYVQNPNVNYVAEPIEYVFLVYDKDNVLIGTREGKALVPPTKTFPIFEPAFNAGERKPVKSVFEFTAPAIWKRFQSVKPELSIADENLKNASSTPRLEASLVNETINKYKDVEVVAIIYNEEGNAVAASKTLVDVLPAEDQVPIVFTWPEPFDFKISKIEIIPKLPIKIE